MIDRRKFPIAKAQYLFSYSGEQGKGGNQKVAIHMSKFQMFESITLNQDIQLHAGGTALRGTDGAILEILKDGEAYLVELFGGWLKFTTEGDTIEASPEDPEAFRDTLDVETIYPDQINPIHVQQSNKQKVKQQLLTLLPTFRS